MFRGSHPHHTTTRASLSSHPHARHEAEHLATAPAVVNKDDPAPRWVNAVPNDLLTRDLDRKICLAVDAQITIAANATLFCWLDRTPVHSTGLPSHSRTTSGSPASSGSSSSPRMECPHGAPRRSCRTASGRALAPEAAFAASSRFFPSPKAA